ncbi:MAG: PIG-L family deacetylase [Anaerolineae bacterium]|jgi:LmbE family N-acetylglucosaminyl deacetylase
MVGIRRYTHVYLSPHLDDVALSCGGRIWQQARAGGHVAVVTVFAAAPEPDARLSSYARELHARWGRPGEAVEKRQEEDLQALSLLDAKPLHWPYTDCIYRRTPGGDFPYASEEALWGDIHPSDAGLIRELAERIRALPLLPEGTLYTPLGVGDHVDHRILRQAAEVSEHALTAYEDFPYAQVREAAERALANRCWESELVLLSEHALGAKIAAIACYGSQTSTFWGSTMDMAAAVRAFAERTGNGRPAERYWRPTLL